MIIKFFLKLVCKTQIDTPHFFKLTCKTRKRHVLDKQKLRFSMSRAVPEGKVLGFLCSNMLKNGFVFDAK